MRLKQYLWDGKTSAYLQLKYNKMNVSRYYGITIGDTTLITPY